MRDRVESFSLSNRRSAKVRCLTGADLTACGDAHKLVDGGIISSQAKLRFRHEVCFGDAFDETGQNDLFNF